MVVCPKLYPIVKNRNPTMTSRAGFTFVGGAPDISECKTRILAGRCIRVYLLAKRDHSNTLAASQWHQQLGRERWEGKTLQKFGTRIDRAAPQVTNVPEGYTWQAIVGEAKRGRKAAKSRGSANSRSNHRSCGRIRLIWRMRSSSKDCVNWLRVVAFQENSPAGCFSMLQYPSISLSSTSVTCPRNPHTLQQRQR